MPEATRRLKDPIAQEDGSQVTHSVATPVSFTVRGAVYVGSTKVIPVIFVPGTMGTHLRVRRDIKLPEDYPLDPGAAAWRPPNSDPEAFQYANDWKKRSPRERQLILHPQFVEVDDGGALDVGSCNLRPDEMRQRGWGEIHHGAYGALLFELQSHLEMTFRVDALRKRHLRKRWIEVMQALADDPQERWGVRAVEPLTERELEAFSAYQYPVYACGYNWLQSCGESARRLERRIDEILAWWRARRHECRQVILVTHSMGGLVARACAKRIPGKIAGIVHGVMPALGAPLLYRRLACGTECDSPTNGAYGNFVAGKFADLAGRRPEDTTPVLAVAPGALELLPNQLYPRPWLHIAVARPARGAADATDYLHLPNESQPNPYAIYRDMDAWYRLVNPALLDPAGLYDSRQDAIRTVKQALDTAEHFHAWLADHYHAATFAWYGADPSYASYGRIRWVARLPAGLSATAANIRNARFMAHEPDGARTVEVDGKRILSFAVEPQDAQGDDTVSQQSGAAPAGKVRQLFATRGVRHQDSYRHRDALLLTHYCIVKIVQELTQHGRRQ